MADPGGHGKWPWSRVTIVEFAKCPCGRVAVVVFVEVADVPLPISALHVIDSLLETFAEAQMNSKSAAH